MTEDPESVAPAASEAHPVALRWDGPQGRYEQLAGARQEAALLYARMRAGYPAAEWVVYRFLEAWREYLRLSLAGLVEDLQPLTEEPFELGPGDVFEQWADLAWVLTDLWPDTSRDAVTTSRALTRLQTAFISDRVDVAAVHREMLTVTNFFGGLEAQVQALVEFRQDRTQD
ncbi:hypothetical protein [Geodermatophilus obscurus]|uniref:hypothetical protein n=1 Tax=Geodermatophilus obscurus TaxID=1861 RepID=UPI00059D036C|nr:hypothetical protein [Geodermatophilus obscurus]